MEEINHQDIEAVRSKLAAKKAELENLSFRNEVGKRRWIRKFIKDYALELKKRYGLKKMNLCRMLL